MITSFKDREHAMQPTPDELLTALTTIPVYHRKTWLLGWDIKLLRACADLCGVDSVAMTKRQAIDAIMENM